MVSLRSPANVNDVNETPTQDTQSTGRLGKPRPQPQERQRPGTCFHLQEQELALPGTCCVPGAQMRWHLSPGGTPIVSPIYGKENRGSEPFGHMTGVPGKGAEPGRHSRPLAGSAGLRVLRGPEW